MPRRPLVLAAVVLLACAHDVRTRVPRTPAAEAEEDVPTATLVLRFTSAADHVHASVNGVSVAEDAHTRQIVVDNVPAGRTTVMVAAGDGPEKAFQLDLAAGERTVVPLSAPAARPGSLLLQAALSVMVYAAYLGLASLL